MSITVSDWRKKKPRDGDAWLADAPEASREICTTLRDWIFQWEPDLTEAIKWQALTFSGRKLVCGIGAFKHHAAITFFRGAELPDPSKIINQCENGVTLRTIRLTTLEGFKREALRKMLHAAVQLDREPSLPKPPKPKREPLPLPDFFAAALNKNRKAAAHFEAMSASCQREYTAWLAYAKRPETREKNLKIAMAALAAGKKWVDRKLA